VLSSVFAPVDGIVMLITTLPDATDVMLIVEALTPATAATAVVTVLNLAAVKSVSAPAMVIDTVAVEAEVVTPGGCVTVVALLCTAARLWLTVVMSLITYSMTVSSSPATIESLQNVRVAWTNASDAEKAAVIEYVIKDMTTVNQSLAAVQSSATTVTQPPGVTTSASTATVSITMAGALTDFVAAKLSTVTTAVAAVAGVNA
jgi:hypothetical protein